MLKYINLSYFQQGINSIIASSAVYHSLQLNVLISPLCPHSKSMSFHAPNANTNSITPLPAGFHGFGHRHHHRRHLRRERPFGGFPHDAPAEDSDRDAPRCERRRHMMRALQTRVAALEAALAQSPAAAAASAAAQSAPAETSDLDRERERRCRRRRHGGRHHHRHHRRHGGFEDGNSASEYEGCGDKRPRYWRRSYGLGFGVGGPGFGAGGPCSSPFGFNAHVAGPFGAIFCPTFTASPTAPTVHLATASA